MNLELSKRNLRRFAELDNISIEDVLNVIYDLCTDVKNESGSTVDQLPCRDEAGLYKRLPWLSRLVIRICQKNADAISDTGRQIHLKELREKVSALTAGLDKAEEEITKTAQEQLDLTNALEKKEAELTQMQESARELLEQVRQKERQVLEEKEQLEEQIRIEQEKLEEEIAQREQEAADCEAERQNLLKIREEKEELLSGEKARYVAAASVQIREEIVSLEAAAAKLVMIRAELLKEILGSQDDQSTSTVSLPEAMDEKLSAIREQLSGFNRALRDYADAMSDEW